MAVDRTQTLLRGNVGDTGSAVVRQVQRSMAAQIATHHAKLVGKGAFTPRADICAYSRGHVWSQQTCVYTVGLYAYTLFDETYMRAVRLRYITYRYGDTSSYGRA